jgi:ABC-2 type transport system ATP-binding protein
MRVAQLVEYTAAFYPRWNAALAGRLLNDWELDPKARVGPLSVGQFQRLAIVLALGHEPDLLVLDEPAASLDPEARRQFLKTVLDLAGAGRTVVFSSHITSDLERVADRVAVLKNGRIVYDGEMDALKDRVKRLLIVAAAPLHNGSFQVPGTLRCTVSGNHAQMSVSAFTPELVADIARRWSASVEVQDLNLEEIFLELHDG